MRKALSSSLAVFVILAMASPAFAEHEEDYNFPWSQTQSVRGPKMKRDENVHWGQHHHHGIYLEGSDYERSPAHRYD